MPHEAGHKEETQVIPPVQLPIASSFDSTQSGRSKDKLALAKQQAVDPRLPVGTGTNPVAQNVGTGEMLLTPGGPTTAPTSAVPTATATQAMAMHSCSFSTRSRPTTTISTIYSNSCRNSTASCSRARNCNTTYGCSTGSNISRRNSTSDN